MSRDEARGLAALETLSPREFERKVEGLFRKTRWTFFHDRDRPTSNRRILKSRQRGLPDFVIYKHFPGQSPWQSPSAGARGVQAQLHVPSELFGLLGVYGSQFPMTVMGYVEVKTGRAKPTVKQAEWLEAASRCPGTFSLVVRPRNYDYLAEVLGGNRNFG